MSTDGEYTAAGLPRRPDWTGKFRITQDDGWSGVSRPAPPFRSDPTTEELGAEPIRNGPEAANHRAWCKQRALAEPDAGAAMSSLIQDFGSDERTRDSIPVIRELMLPLAMMGALKTPAKLRDFILEF
jgi:hypothetical protein